MQSIATAYNLARLTGTLTPNIFKCSKNSSSLLCTGYVGDEMSHICIPTVCPAAQAGQHYCQNIQIHGLRKQNFVARVKFCRGSRTAPAAGGGGGGAAGGGGGARRRSQSPPKSPR